MQTAKLFINGRSQAVRLPASCRFEGHEVFVRRDPDTGDVILSRRPPDWSSFMTALDNTAVPADFLADTERQHGPHPRDPLDGVAS